VWVQKQTAKQKQFKNSSSFEQDFFSNSHYCLWYTFSVLLPPLEIPGEVISGQHPADILFILNHPGTRSGPIAHSSAREEDNIARDELGGVRRMGK
jgi:hypothetical protein